MRFLRIGRTHEQRIYQVAAATIGAVVVGGVASSMAAGNAADAQAEGIASSNAISQRQYDQTRADNQPWIDRGSAAANELQFRMGLGGGSGGVGGGIGASQLGSTAGAWTPNSSLYSSSPEYRAAWDQFMSDHNARYGRGPSGNEFSSVLPAELAARGFNLDDYNKQAEAAAAQDPNYGSLTRKFSQSDLDSDVVLNATKQFATDQGQLGLNRLAAANGSLNSGQQQKALARFNTGLASQLSGDAYNRFNTDNTNTYNRLAGISGTGQTAINNVNSAGSVNAGTQSQNALALGNSRAASAIATGNSINSGLGAISNYYQGQNMLDQLRNGGINYGTGYSGSSAGGTFGGAGSYGSY